MRRKSCILLVCSVPILLLCSQTAVNAQSSSWNWGFVEGDRFYYHMSGSGSSVESGSDWSYSEDLYIVMDSPDTIQENVTRFFDIIYSVFGDSSFYLNGTYTGFSRVVTWVIAIGNWTEARELLTEYLSVRYSELYDIEYIDTQISWGFRVNWTNEDPYITDEHHWEFSKETGLTTYWLYKQIEFSPGHNQTEELILFNPLIEQLVFLGLPIGVTSIILIAVVYFYRRR